MIDLMGNSQRQPHLVIDCRYDYEYHGNTPFSPFTNCKRGTYKRCNSYRFSTTTRVIPDRPQTLSIQPIGAKLRQKELPSPQDRPKSLQLNSNLSS